MKKPLLILFTLLLGTIFYAQTTLVNYKFNNNLTPEAGSIGSPMLKYYNSAGTEITPATYDASRLKAVNTGDYLELTINTTGLYNINVSFDARFDTSGFFGFGVGTWTLSNNYDANTTNVFMVSLFGGAQNDSLSTTWEQVQTIIRVWS